MALVESVPEIAIGVAVELVVFVVAAFVVYRLFSGRFLIPKREIILPNQRGVVVQEDRVVRVNGPGTCWLRPRQRVVLVDMRPKPLQLAGVEVLGSDHGVVRLSLSAEYTVADPAVYYSTSANAADALFVQLRRVINVAARQMPSSKLSNAPEEFSTRILLDIGEAAKRLGLVLVQLDIYEALPLGTMRIPEESTFDFPDSGMVH